MTHRNFAQIPNALARLLLTKYKWDVMTFLERFYDEEMDMGQVASAKVRMPRKRTRKQQKVNKSCDICMDEIESTESLELTCSHSFCMSCWCSYLDHTINNGTLQSVSCPGCPTLIDDNLIIPYITTDQQRNRFTQIITNSFVQFNRLIKWCGAANCTMAIKVQTVTNTLVKCSCSHQFCFECNGSAHILINCKMLSKFNELRGNALSDAQWLSKHSKPCPSCNVNIEKNGGCNFMTCGSCNVGFCWLCLNLIKHENITNHPNCQSPEAVRLTALRSRQLVDCNIKFNDQEDSINFDKKMYNVNLNQNEVNEENHWCKVDFIHEAVNVLLDSRHTLKDSFIFQLLMTDHDSAGNKLKLFEMNQGDLRTATEKLSRILETQVNDINYQEMRKKVEQLTLYCRKSCRSLTELVHEGYTYDYWKSIDENKYEKLI